MGHLQASSGLLSISCHFTNLDFLNHGKLAWIISWHFLYNSFLSFSRTLRYNIMISLFLQNRSLKEPRRLVLYQGGFNSSWPSLCPVTPQKKICHCFQSCGKRSHCCQSPWRVVVKVYFPSSPTGLSSTLRHHTLKSTHPNCVEQEMDVKTEWLAKN